MEIISSLRQVRINPRHGVCFYPNFSSSLCSPSPTDMAADRDITNGLRQQGIQHERGDCQPIFSPCIW